jgi:ClpP class serine protease
MDLKTGLSIYNKHWLIQSDAAIRLLDFFEQVKEGKVAWDWNKAKGENGVASSYEIKQKFFQISGVITAPENSWDMKDFKGFEGSSIAVIPITGPLMKSDFCGSFGTSTLKMLVSMAANTDSVKTIIFPIDTPGGTVDGTQALADEISNCGKQTIGLADGMMCSAGYWIGSSCSEIYASSKTDIIGCIGTMLSLQDNTEAMKARGIVRREYYADDSKDKNGAINEAIKGNGKALIEELLNPMNNAFLGAVRNNRAGKIKEDALSGKDYTSENALAIGLIDGIKTFDQIIKTAKQSNNSYYTLNNKKMAEIKTLSDLQAALPELCTEIEKAGATKERKRINSWLKWQSVDAEKVNAAIASGAEFDMEAQSDLSEKKISQMMGKKAEAENELPVKTGEVPKPGSEAATKADATKNEFFAMLNIPITK